MPLKFKSKITDLENRPDLSATLADQDDMAAATAKTKDEGDNELWEKIKVLQARLRDATPLVEPPEDVDAYIESLYEVE